MGGYHWPFDVSRLDFRVFFAYGENPYPLGSRDVAEGRRFREWRVGDCFPTEDRSPASSHPGHRATFQVAGAIDDE